MVDTDGVPVDEADRRSHRYALGLAGAFAASAGLLAVWVAPALGPIEADSSHRGGGFILAAVFLAALGALGAVAAPAAAQRRQARLWFAVAGWLLVLLGVVTEQAWLLGAGVVMAFGALSAIVVAPNAYPPRSPWLALWGSGVAVVAIVLVVHVVSYAVAPGWEEGRPPRRSVLRRLLDRSSRHRRPAVEVPADLWHRAAVSEAESVPTFQALAARLGALGAPPTLIDRCHTAAADEERHARACRHLARHHGSLTTPAPSPAQPPPSTQFPASQLGRRVELARLAVDSVVDGLGGEGFAAARLEAGAATVDAHAARLQRAIASDEEAHAQLATDVAAWCLHSDPAVVAPSLRLAARRLDRSVSTPAPHRQFDDEQLAKVGMVSPEVAADLWRRQREVARSRVDALLADVR